jgi:hypothetical protein
MKRLALALAVALCSSAAPALAQTPATWVGSANYGVETVGPFNTYDFSSAGVLLQDNLTETTANTYYQSFVTNHLLDGLIVSNPLLSAGDYEITVVANFASALTSANSFGQTYTVDSGSFALWLDTTPDLSFATDSGFDDGIKILEGVVVGGAGSNVIFGAQKFGGGSLQLQVTSFDASIFSPATIGGGESVFTLRLNAPVDSAFLDQIDSVQGVAYLPETGDLRYAADGNLILTPVPEPEGYAMLLAGLGIIGAIARRRMSV